MIVQSLLEVLQAIQEVALKLLMYILPVQLRMHIKPVV